MSSYIGSGTLWGWLQNIVGVSNQVIDPLPQVSFHLLIELVSQIAWLSIGLSSWRFRKAWIAQGRTVEDLKFTAQWTWPWGPAFVVIAVSGLIMGKFTMNKPNVHLS